MIEYKDVCGVGVSLYGIHAIHRTIQVVFQTLGMKLGTYKKLERMTIKIIEVHCIYMYICTYYTHTRHDWLLHLRML